MPDICLSNHKGNPESNAANKLTAKARGLATCHLVISNNGNFGATCDEIEQLTGLSHQTASARCSELLKAGLVIRKPGQPLYERRPTRTGSMAAVLVAPALRPTVHKAFEASVERNHELLQKLDERK